MSAFAQSGVAPAAADFAEIDWMRRAGRFEEALLALERLRAVDAGRPVAAVLWRLARTQVDLGEQAPSAEAQRARYGAALDLAREATRCDPQCAPAFLARAVAAGRLALVSGTRRKIELSREVRESTDRALALDPDLALAYHIRGRWHYEVADLGFVERTVVRVVYGGVPEASFARAADDFRQAIRREDVIVHHLGLGRTYLKLGDRARARAEFERVLAMPVTDPDDPAYQAEARALLEKLR